MEALNDNATLIINSKEQIICEKLKSLLRFGIRSTRYKDIFDMYFLINKTSINNDELLSIMYSLIFNDKTMRENNLYDIVKNLKTTINNNIFKHNLLDARNNWLGVSVDEVINSVIMYFESLETIIV